MTAHFGVLDGDKLSFQPGLNVIYAPNESGKSTWCAFLRAMLFGVNTAERAKQGQQPDKSKYRPWGGAPMSGSIDLDTANGPVTLRRWTERANQPMQAFAATVTGTEMAVPGLTATDAGEQLTGVPREVFERTAFIRQAGLGVTADAELDKRLAAIVTAGDEEQSYTEADKLLKTWLRRRRSAGKKGAIPQLEADLADTRQELGLLMEASGVLEDMDHQIALAQRDLDRARQRREEVRRVQRESAREAYNRARDALKAKQTAHHYAQEHLDQARAALATTPFGDGADPDEVRRRAEEHRKTAAELARRADNMPPVWPAFIPLGLGVLAFVLAMLLPWTIPLAAAGAIGVLVFVVMFWRLQAIQKTRGDLLEQRWKILERYGVDDPDRIVALAEEYRGLYSAAREAESHFTQAETALKAAETAIQTAEEQYMNGMNVTDGTGQAARANQAVDLAQQRLEELRRRRDRAAGRAETLGDPLILGTELAAGVSRLQELKAQEQALLLAIDTLEQADRELRERFSPQLARDGLALFSMLTDGRYDELTLARDLTAKARPTGDDVGRPADSLSMGARDQMYLALRLAMCRLILPPEQNCPIVLDDALVSFDRERMERALTLLKAEAARRQVLLFTCHEREYDYFAQDPAVTRIKLGE